MVQKTSLATLTPGEAAASVPDAKYPNAWSAPGSAQRNAPHLVDALRPHLARLPDAARVLEVASGFGVQLRHVASDHARLDFWPSEADRVLCDQIDAAGEAVTGGIRDRGDDASSSSTTPTAAASSASAPTSSSSSAALRNVHRASLLDLTCDDNWIALADAARAAAGELPPDTTLSTGSRRRNSLFAAVLAFNLLHICPWHVTQALFSHLDSARAYADSSTGRPGDGTPASAPSMVDPSVGFLAIYGAFKRRGRFVSEGDAKFDATIRARDASFGLRDVEGEVLPLAQKHGWELAEEISMPAGNLLLIFRPTSPST